MNCGIVNAVNLITNGSTSEIKLSFDVKNEDVIIGTCKIFIRNVFVEFELNSDKGNFSFQPSNENQKECFDSENVINSNHLSFNEEKINVKVKEEDTNEMPKNVAENQRPDRKCEDIVKIKLEKDFFADPPSNYIDQIQDEVAQPIAKKNNDETFKVLNQSSPTINRVENFGLQMGYKDNCDLIIRDKENIPIFLRSEVGLNIGVHTSMHSFEKPFVCKVCGKFFTQRGNLNRHTRTHTGEKPFECGVCGKAFTQKSNLDVHTRIHTGEKPFECEVCGKRLSQKISLIAHTKIHTR